jgi:hypothetical protein
MMSFRSAIFLLCVASFFPVSCSAQIHTFAGSFSDGPNPVTGLPYSAVQETEETQTLTDGTHVVQKHQTRLYRDSSGRMRWEVFVPIDWNPAQKTPEIVTIIDPIAKAMYTLRPQTHIANLASLSEPPPPPPPPDSPDPPAPNISDSVDQYVSVLRSRYSNKTSEDLGSKMMEGLLVQGVRTTWTLPVGSDGNDRPIVEIDEIWTSTDLGLTILSKHSDSRTGETVSRVTSLDRSEPDPALFQMPQDYTLQPN